MESPEQSIRQELGPSEQLLWCGQPRRGLVLRPADAFLVPFSILWGGIAIVFEVAAIASRVDLFFALWGVPFVLVGLHMMVGRFWVDARQRAATVYAITSERIMIISGLLSRSVRSLSIETLSDVTLTERASGAGQITFGSAPFFHSWLVGTAWPGLNGQAIPTFDLPGQAREVYDIIREARQAARQNA